MFKGNSEDQFPSRKRQRSDESSGNELRLLIPGKLAGAIIGKGGENVKRLRSEFSSSVSIPDSSSPERIFSVQGEEEDNIAVVRDCLTKFEDYFESDRNHSGEVDVRMLVHNSHAGAVIGRGGYKIKEITEETKCNIKVFTECCPQSTERVARLTGDTDAVISAIRKILEVCNENPLKSRNRPYDTFNYDGMFVADYGGYEDFYSGSARGNTMMLSFDSFGGRGRGRARGGMMRGISMRGNSYGRGGSFYDMPFSMDYGAMPMLGGVRGPCNTMSQSLMPPTQSAVQTIQFTIPSELSGIIIGKRGEQINRVRDESGAHIVVEEQNQYEDERVITISGLPNQIQMAQYMLQQCVRSSAVGRRYVQQLSAY